MIAELLNVVAPVFGIALVGWIFASWRRVDLSTLSEITLYLAAPALVFSGLAGKTLQATRLLTIGGGAIFQCLACGAATWLVFRLFHIKGRGLYLAAMFPNTGNLGLPLALFAFGQEGLTVAVVVFVSITLVHYSLGLMIVSGAAHPGKALKSPLFLAASLGACAALMGYTPPLPLSRGVELLGEACVPLMLLSLGIRMRRVHLKRPVLTLLLVALRMLPGLAAGLLWVSLFGLHGAERGVILVTGVLPSAVMNFVLAEAAGQQGEDVASTILLGTLLSLVAIPLVLAFVV